MKKRKLLLPLRQERFGPGSIYCYILHVGFFNVHAIADIDYKTGNGQLLAIVPNCWPTRDIENNIIPAIVDSYDLNTNTWNTKT